MKTPKSFEQTVLNIALPVTLQSLLQSSFSVVDQVMIGRLGSGSIAGIGLGGKFASLYSVVLAAIASAAGIMIAQYIGKKEGESVSRSFTVSMILSVGLAVLFLLPCLLFPGHIMSLYTKDDITRQLAASYIRTLALSFLPMAVSSIVTTMLRCMEAASLPLYSGIFALILNTGLNYLFIFGKWCFPEMGVRGAALASVIAQSASCLIILVFFAVHKKKQGFKLHMRWKKRESSPVQNGISGQIFFRQYSVILGPLLLCEFLWSLGENIYTAIYGNIGTDACAAMTMTVPVQTIVIGALSGLSQAAGILIGKSLGAEEYSQAYTNAKKLLRYGLAASFLLSLLLVVISPFYVKLYQVDSAVQEITKNLLFVIALIAPVKVLNMILGGGILRSGGKTKYAMWIDMAGTWIFGVPLGLLSAFVWKLPITPVYFILSLEECVRLGISFLVFRRKTWMNRIQ